MRAARFGGLGFGLLAVLAPLAVGCTGPAEAPSPSPTGAALAPAISAPTSTPTPSPAPSGPVGSDAGLRVVAAKAYLAAAQAYNAAKRALSPHASRTFEQTSAYYRALAKVEHAFLVAVRAMEFPTDVRSRVDLVLKLTAESEAWQLKGSAAQSQAALDGILPSIVRADQAASLAADLLRKALGLPQLNL
ncbi:MAG: hypothetical protein M3P84_02105 [Chloroflexota bacterium]|nr:hypothetical protein [Chloroflexota bacterium]